MTLASVKWVGMAFITKCIMIPVKEDINDTSYFIKEEL